MIAGTPEQIADNIQTWFEDGAADRPVIVGVIEPHALQDDPPPAPPGIGVQADGERHVIQAEREIVLQCGESSSSMSTPPASTDIW